MTGQDMPAWVQGGFDHLWLPYTQMASAPLPTPVVGTEGVRIRLADGRELIDGCSSWWTACHGYRHPHIVAAMHEQIDRLPHVMMGGLANEPAFTLAARLARLLPGDLNRVFFAESGSVSVEVAMKAAIQYWINRGEVCAAAPHKRFVHFDHGYHGDTMGAMSVCDVDRGMHHVFKGALAEQIRLPLPVDGPSRARFEEAVSTRTNELAAVIMEPLVQGAGGLKFHDAQTVRFIREVTDAHGVLLIFDEIMTGFGRTGALFACEAAGVVPDIITLSKALTGGVAPLAVAVTRDRVSEAFIGPDPAAALMHGPTFMGHALGCAAAHASLDLFEQEPRLEQVAAIEAHLKQVLEPARAFPGVVDVRARGAIGVIEVAEMREVEALKAGFIEAGVFIRPMFNVIYVAPPFILQGAELATLTDAMLEVTEAWARRVYN